MRKLMVVLLGRSTQTKAEANDAGLIRARAERRLEASRTEAFHAAPYGR